MEPRSDEHQSLAALLTIYSSEELQVIVKESKALIANGYGRLTIVFHNHHPKLVEVAQSKELPHRTPADRAKFKPAGAAVE